MKIERSKGQDGASTFPSTRLLNSCLACLLVWVISSSLHAVTVNATFNSATDVPFTASSYNATGNTIQISLNFAPSTGTSLTVVRNTGLNFIQGKFDNLAQGQIVNFNYGGLNYYFTANYYAHGGRDLVLQWTNVRPFAWGRGANGQLGNQDTANSSAAVTVNTAGVLWGKLPASGAAGGNHSLGLCSDGTVVAWGLNTNGQLGNNSTTTSNVPVAVTISGVPATRTVAAISAGASHSLALCSDGTVVSWGLNTNGQLGNNSTTQSTVPVAVPISGVPATRTVAAVSAGASHSLALCTDGTVVSWGLNANGQLGNNSTTQSTVPVAVTTSSGALAGKTVVSISAGASHSLALCSDGTVVSWGLNTNGQLGNNSTTQSTVPVAVTISGVPATRAVVGISGGASHSLALCSDRTVVSWGLNTSGQLGNGNNTQSTVPVAVTSSGILYGKSVFMVSAGANHSIAHCQDGTVATWGLGTSGQLGNQSTSSSNTPVAVDTSVLNSGMFIGVFSGVVSGSSANHTLSVASSPEIDVSNFVIQKQITYDQSSAAAPALDSNKPYMFSSYVQAGSMGQPLSSSTLTPPPGSTGAGIYQPGSYGMRLQQNFTSKTAMDAAFTTGTYFLKIQTSTPNTYNTQLTFGSDNYPAIPQITGITNATWSGGALKVTNYAQPVTITWSNPGGASSHFQIDNTNINSGGDLPSTSFTIPGNSLQNDSVYRGSVQLNNGGVGTSIPGLPGVTGNSSYQSLVQFVILTGTASAAKPDSMYLLIKNNILVQTSNNNPMDSSNALPDSDPAPYSLTMESPVGGTVTGPGSTSFPLGFHADNDGSSYLYSSGAAASSSVLDASHPDGSYTFPGSLSVSLTGGGYPAATKILTVNGGTPVWDAQGELALDPTVDNTITWSPVTVPNFETNGHQGVYFENYSDYNFPNISMENGVLGSSPTPVTSLTIPKSTMTPTFTYVGNVNYISAPTVGNPSANVYVIGGFQTETQFVAVALKPQTITFGAIPDLQYPAAPIVLGATASSGLPVSYSVVSGPATVSGNTVTLTGAGIVTVQSTQAGTGVYASAVSVTQSFTVTATLLVSFRADNGLASDGSQDLLVPANDGVPNLLKFAFNMIGTGQGQAATLSIPNVWIVGASGTAGLPKQGMNGSGRLTLTYIRRKAATLPGVTYAVEFSNSLSPGSWGINGSATESAANIDSNFERVTVTDSMTTSKRFARVRVSEN